MEERIRETPYPHGPGLIHSASLLASCRMRGRLPGQTDLALHRTICTSTLTSQTPRFKRGTTRCNGGAQHPLRPCGRIGLSASSKSTTACCFATLLLVLRSHSDDCSEIGSTDRQRIQGSTPYRLNQGT
ncbi:hypothetical protein BJX76DRAFT_75762 [Aspergillus varians]